MREPSVLEKGFGIAWRGFAKGLPQPVPEYTFHPSRRWRIDFAWPSERVAVEVEGGIYGKGRHTSVQGFLGDIEKYNALAEAGWLLLRYSGPHINGDPSGMVDQISRVLQTWQSPQP